MVSLPVRGRFGQSDSVTTESQRLHISKLHDTGLDKADRKRME